MMGGIIVHKLYKEGNLKKDDEQLPHICMASDCPLDHFLSVRRNHKLYKEGNLKR
jgi:hypothetical protein